MAKTNPTNEDRAAWAHTALMAFMRVSGTRYEASLGDLLTDLMHMADRDHVDFAAELQRGTAHYQAEKDEARDDRRQAIVEMAREQYHSEGEVEIDEGARLSEGDDNGTYVQAWIWVDFSGTEFDKGDP